MSGICIRGNHLDDLEGFFKKIKYRVVSVKTVEGAWPAIEFLAGVDTRKGGARKIAYIYLGWTHLLDSEKVLINEEAALANLSKSLHTTIVTWLADTESKSYGFGLYEAGLLRRQVLAVDGDVTSSKGKPIEAERKLRWGKVRERDLLATIKRLGVVYAGYPEARIRCFDLDDGSGGG